MIHVLVETSSPDLQAEIAFLIRDRPEFRLIENSGNSADEASGGEGHPQPDVVIAAVDESEPALESVGWNAAGVPIILLIDNPPGGDAERWGRFAERWGPHAEHFGPDWIESDRVGPDQVGKDWIGEGFPEAVRAVLPRNVTRAELAAAIEAVAAGLFVFHPADADLLPALRPREAGPGIAPPLDEPPIENLTENLIEPLTPREIEVLQLLAAGLGNKEIAARLNISEHTAKFHVASIMGKLGAASRTEAVTLGIRHGLVMI
jgi:DNA-binding CsgD family transcriptional regulator